MLPVQCFQANLTTQSVRVDQLEIMASLNSLFKSPRFKTRAQIVWSVGLVAVAGIVVLLPALIRGIPAGHDLPNHLRLALPFYNAIHAGNLHPGWLLEANHGFGDPSLRFYPPALYYLLAATRGLTGNWYAGILLGFPLLSVLGGLGVYFWARFLPNNLAVLAGILYAFVPYRINEFYGASFLAEYAAAAVLPFAFGFVLRVCKDNRPGDVAGLALSFALLVMTNLPLAVIGSLSLLLYAAVTIEKARFRQSLLRLCLGVGLGLAASAVYWTTMVAELSWIRNASLNPAEDLVSYFDYRKNFVFSPFSLGNTNSWLASMLELATLAIAVAPLLMLVWPGWKLSRPVKGLLALLAFSLLMTTDLSRPLWFVIPKLKEVQFPWRWLAVSSIAVSILAAASIPFCRDRLRGKLRPVALVVIGVVLVAIAYSGARIRDANYIPRFEFNSVINHVFARDSLDYWLPIWVHERPQPMPHEVQATAREVRVTEWEPEQRSFSVGAGPAEEIRVRTFYYPHWQARTGDKLLAIRAGPDGVMLISIPADATIVKLDFIEPRRARVATAVTITAWGLIVLLMLYGFRVHRYQDAGQHPALVR
jgi:hypothetical protein